MTLADGKDLRTRDPFLSFSPLEGWLDLVTFTHGRLNVNPNLSLLCKACEAILLEFKAYKSAVQANIQFVIDNKEKIQAHGLIFTIPSKTCPPNLNLPTVDNGHR